MSNNGNDISTYRTCMSKVLADMQEEKVRATRNKSRAIIEAEQNIFRDIFMNISLFVGFSRLTSCILFK